MFESRRSNHKEKIIISAALTGAVTTKKDNPALPTQPDEIDLMNHHRMLPGCQYGTKYNYEYTVGGKTGYTNEAGFAMATFAKDTASGHTYCCIISKSSTAATCGGETISMFEKYVPGSKAKVPGAADAPAPATTTTAKAA